LSNDNNGKIFYDIRYQALAPKGCELETELIINIAGFHTEDRENYDLMSIVMIYLGDETDKVSSPILNLLNRLLSEKLSAEEKLEMLETEYNISRTEQIEKELSHMCNLSQGVFRRGVEKGFRESFEKSLMYKSLLTVGVSTEIIDKALELSVDKIIEERNVKIAKELIKSGASFLYIVDFTGLPFEIIADLVPEKIDFA